MEPSDPRPTAVSLPRVLVVEDEAIVRLVIAIHLADHGFSVVETASAGEAVSILKDDRFVVVVFSDISMPGAMDGVDLAKWIDRKRPELKILLTSGMPMPGGNWDWPFVAKPYRLEDIELRLRTQSCGRSRRYGIPCGSDDQLSTTVRLGHSAA
jgi:CheY-like chemotaxis protein